MSSLEHKFMQQQESNQSLRRENIELQSKIKKVEERLKAYTKVGDIERNLNKVIHGLKKSIKDKDVELEAIKKEIKDMKETREREGSAHNEDRPKVPSAQKHRAEPKEVKIPALPAQGAPHGHCMNCAKSKVEISRLA